MKPFNAGKVFARAFPDLETQMVNLMKSLNIQLMKMRTQLINEKSVAKIKSTTQNVVFFFFKLSKLNNPLVTTLSKRKRKIEQVMEMKARS